MNARSRRPTETTIVPRLLDAVEALCAERSPRDLTMRDVAREAGLSVGVAYRYFESRDALIGAAMERMGERIATAGTANDDPVKAMTALWRVMSDNPAFGRLVTTLSMSGRTVTEVMAKNPLARDITSKASDQGMPDPSTVAGITLLLGIGGSFYGPTVNSATGRDSDDHRLYEAVAEMFALWIEKEQLRPIEPDPVQMAGDTGSDGLEQR
jgi:AcrR family transcriptional regulator